MPGIYIHIPFCKSRCLYCDFYSTTCLDQRDRYIDALLAEWSIRQSKHGGAYNTLYIGGGTPSQLTLDQLKRLLSPISDRLSPTAEVTIEANPADLTPEYLKGLRSLGINRLSIGVQSFNDKLLKIIGRRHTSADAMTALIWAREAGFDNISADLIFGLPKQSLDEWAETEVASLLKFRPEHISTYCLSYEPGTALTRLRDQGKVKEQDENRLNWMYEEASELFKEAGYEHYEVSNFALPNHRSQHNSSYWHNIPYLGLGAGAHSYDGKTRSWNIGNLERYIDQAMAQSLIPESETLTPYQRYIESIMLGLRLNEGIDTSLIKTTDQWETVRYYEKNYCLEVSNNHIVATMNGLHILNQIIEDLIYDEEEQAGL